MKETMRQKFVNWARLLTNPEVIIEKIYLKKNLRQKNFNSARIPLWVILLCLATLVFGIADHDLWRPDEPREAAIGFEMATGSDWLIPHLAGVPFVEKPPLYYWMSAVSILSFGDLIGPTAAARSLSAFAAAACLVMIYFATRSYLGKRGAWGPVLVLVTFYGFWRGAHWIIIDTVLTFYISAAVFFIFLGLDRDKRILIPLGYFLAGAAFLTKGMVAWVIIFLPWGLLFYLYRQRVKKHIFTHLLGIILLLGPSLAWALIFKAKAGPELWNDWFWDNQFGRFLGTSVHLGNMKGPLYYFWLFPLILLPWTPALIGWFWGKGWRRLKDYQPGQRNLVLLSLAWLLGSFIILTISGTKREPYLYPLLPAAAILVLEGIKIAPRWSRISLFVVSIIFTLPLLVFSFLSLDWMENELVVKPTFQSLVLIGAMVAGFAFFKFKRKTLARTAATSALLYLGYTIIAHPILNKVWSYKSAAMTVAAAIPPGYEDRIAIWPSGEVSRGLFFFYSGLKLVCLSDREMARMTKILHGEDPQCDLVVVPRYNHFRDEIGEWPPWRVLAQKQKGCHQIFALITGYDFIPTSSKGKSRMNPS